MTSNDDRRGLGEFRVRPRVTYTEFGLPEGPERPNRASGIKEDPCDKAQCARI
jgi:hypothetical protein